MRLQYDRETDSLYIHLNERTGTDAEEVSEGIVLDYAEDGTLVGIDIQHASQRTDVARMIFEQSPADAA